MPANLLSRWLDRFLIRVILLFVSVLLYYRLFQNLLISALLGLLTLICLDLVLRILKREEKKKLTAEQERRKQATLNQLVFSTKRDALSLYYEIARAKVPATTLEPPYILMDDEGKRMAMTTEFSVGTLQPERLLECYQNLPEGIEELFVLCIAADARCRTVIQSVSAVKIHVLEGDLCYRLLQENGIYPKLSEKPVKVKRARMILSSAFSRKNFKGYFFSGLLILALSFVTPFSLYYRIFGSVLLLLSAYTLRNRRFNKKDPPSAFFLYR